MTVPAAQGVDDVGTRQRCGDVPTRRGIARGKRKCGHGDSTLLLPGSLARDVAAFLRSVTLVGLGLTSRALRVSRAS